MTCYKAVIFDLDGTLVDSLQGIAYAMNQVLVKRGCRPLPVDDYVRYIGKGVRELIAQAWNRSLTSQELDEYEVDLSYFYSQCFLQKTNIFKGMDDVLCFLQSQGVYLAVLSNKPHCYTEPLVRQLFPKVSFSYIRGIDEEDYKKPHLYFLKDCLKKMGTVAEETLFVGDSLIDARLSQKGGVDFYFVHWGYCFRQKELFDILENTYYEGRFVKDLYLYFKKIYS